MIDFLRAFPSSKSYIKTITLVLMFTLASYSNLALSAAPLDINAATAEQFAAVMSGVGNKKARAIIQYREQNGEFSELDELIFVKGIGPSLLKKNREYLSIGPGQEYKGEELADLPL